MAQFPTVRPPALWDREVWGPGETLSLVLVDSPGWDDWSTDIEEIRDLISEGMRAWEDVPTADIRWRITEIVSREDLVDPDAHYITTQTGNASSTTVWSRRHYDGVFYTNGVVIRISEEHIADSNLLRYVILHELGHAVGLAHASVYSRGGRPENVPEGLLTRSWRFDPVMSYGHVGQYQRRSFRSMLTADDRVGASLVRPRNGWLQGTGNIRGTVVLDGGGGAGVVHVLAVRLRADGRAGEGVGAFTNLHGEFVIGGLAPGEYVLLVRALAVHRAHPKLLPWIDTAIRDTIWGAPLTVRPGARAGPVTIVVGSGPERAKL